MRRRSLLSLVDPIGERLLNLALDHGTEVLNARERAARRMGADLGSVGVVLVDDGGGFTAVGAPIAEVLALAVTYNLDVTAGAPGFWPCLVSKQNEACVCWLKQESPHAVRGVA